MVLMRWHPGKNNLTHKEHDKRYIVTNLKYEFEEKGCIATKHLMASH